MTLDQYRDVADRALEPFVNAAESAGLTPNGVSVVAMAFAIGAGACFAFGQTRPVLYFVGGLFVFGNGWLDLIDGALARRTGAASAFGDLLDHVLDRYADIVMIVGLAAGVEQWAVGLAAVTGVLMTSYLGTQAQAVGLDRVYGGLVGRADRLALIGLVAAAATIYPSRTLYGFTIVGMLLVFFAVVGHFTALQRFYYALRGLSDGGL